MRTSGQRNNLFTARTSNKTVTPITQVASDSRKVWRGEVPCQRRAMTTAGVCAAPARTDLLEFADMSQICTSAPPIQFERIL